MSDEAAASIADPAQIAALLQTALHDRGGESVEGAFVDRWESHAGQADRALDAAFRRHGFSAQSAEQVRQALRDPQTPADMALRMVQGLQHWLRPLLVELRDDRLPHVRALAVEAIGLIGAEPDHQLAQLRDPDPSVRVAAIAALRPHQELSDEARRALLAALADPDERVRLAAATALPVFGQPEAGAALARFLAEPCNGPIRDVAIGALAHAIRSRGAGADREALGEPLRLLLIAELDSPDPQLRIAVSRALEWLAGVDVAAAVLARLQVERDPAVRATLALFPHFHLIAAQSLPVLSELLARDPDPLVRTRVGHLLQGFGAAATPPLSAALDDPDGTVRRAATISLGRSGDHRALARLAHELSNPASRWLFREVGHVIQDITLRQGTTKVSADLRSAIQRRIDGWRRGP